MNRQTIIFFFFSTFIMTLLGSCWCSCDCDRNIGCTILTVKQISNDSVLMKKIFCAQTNYETDKVRKDSVDNFTAQHQTANTTVTAKDSIYKYERVEDVKCKDKDGYKNDGFGCMCYK